MYDILNVQLYTCTLLMCIHGVGAYHSCLCMTRTCNLSAGWTQKEFEPAPCHCDLAPDNHLPLRS